jgi:predicted nuclease of predicted toxin-antitoxin system
MTPRLLIDMNLTPDWVPYLSSHGIDAIHWDTVGRRDAPDAELMTWAVQSGRVVFTHDLDFGTALALTHATGPSVLQLRGREVFPDQVGAAVVAAVRQHQDDLNAGALVVIDAKRCRVRVLPL